MLKRGLYSRRVGASAAVYLASALESIIEDIVECAASQADIQKKHALTPRHIQLGIRQDPELSKLFSNCSINMGGILPHAHLMRKDQAAKMGMGGTQTVWLYITLTLKIIIDRFHFNLTFYFIFIIIFSQIHFPPTPSNPYLPPFSFSPRYDVTGSFWAI